MDDDLHLLRQYASTGSEPAFRKVVEHHIQLVNSTARRIAGGNAHLAEDVTQLVFTDLARKAAALPDDTILGGWLHRHTSYTAAKAVRAEIRRRTRERTAMEMHAVNETSADDAHWQRLAPVLDDALNHLETLDRNAIVLRYLQGRDLRSVGRAIGLSDDAAQKRVGRALEKLRGFLAHRGVTLSAAMLATSLDAGAKTAVPHGLAAAVSAQATTAAATATFTLSNLQTMITSKLSLTLASVLVVTGAAVALATHDNSAPTGSPANASAPELKTPVAASAPAVVQAPAPATAGQPAPAVATSANSSGTSATFSTGAPESTPTEFHSGTVRISNGQVITTTNDNGAVQTQTQALPDTGSVSGGGQYSSYTASNGAGPTTAFPMPTGDPIATTVNADGSTTKTYAGANGATIEVTVSADGKSTSMQSTLGTPPASR
jgi:RNA polymerase sigma factor (sigma-70 family)